MLRCGLTCCTCEPCGPGSSRSIGWCVLFDSDCTGPFGSAAGGGAASPAVGAAVRSGRASALPVRFGDGVVAAPCSDVRVRAGVRCRSVVSVVAVVARTARFAGAFRAVVAAERLAAVFFVARFAVGAFAVRVVAAFFVARFAVVFFAADFVVAFFAVRLAGAFFAADFAVAFFAVRFVAVFFAVAFVARVAAVFFVAARVADFVDFAAFFAVVRDPARVDPPAAFIGFALPGSRTAGPRVAGAFFAGASPVVRSRAVPRVRFEDEGRVGDMAGSCARDARDCTTAAVTPACNRRVAASTRVARSSSSTREIRRPMLDTATALDASPPTTASRLFFALFPDAATAAAIAALAVEMRTRHGLRGKPVPTDKLHCTVNYLGTFPALPVELVGAAKVAAARVACDPVPVEFDTVASFDSRRRVYPLVLRGCDNGPLRTLQRALTGSLLATRAIATPEPYEPHVTLLRDRTLLPAEAVAPVRWTAGELVLVHSHVGLHRHEALARFPLDGTASA